MPVLLAGAGVAAAGTAIGLKAVRGEQIPRTALLSSSFFVASLIHIPLGPSSVHLILNGLIGLLLGWAAFPAILLALLLQAILLQFGGFTTLGINTMNMALPGVFCYYLFHKMIIAGKISRVVVCGFLSGFLGVFIAGIFMALSLFFTGEYFAGVAKLVIITHLPVMVIEGVVTTFVVLFLRRVKPQMLES